MEKFEVIDRSKGHIFTVIHAKLKNPQYNMSLYLDNDTGSVLYPVQIEPVLPVPGVIIILDSDTASSCTLPPSVSNETVNDLITQLTVFNDIVDIARELIQKEQQKIEDRMLTFADLYAALDFKDCCLKHLRDFDWEVEISKFAGKNIRLYKRNTKDGDFIRRLLIFFNDDDVELRSVFGHYDYCTRHIRIGTLIQDRSWHSGLFTESGLAEDCADFLTQFIRALKNNN